MTASPSEYYNDIAELLVENGFEWLVEQVQSQIDDGKPLFKSVDAPVVESESQSLSLPSVDVNGRPRRKRTRLVTSTPYSDTERLDLLLNAIEIALGMRSALSASLVELLPEFETISFEPDTSLFELAQPTEARRGHRIERTGQVTREALARRAIDAIASVRGDLDASS
jgi:hypothetical protein